MTTTLVVIHLNRCGKTGFFSGIEAGRPGLEEISVMAKKVFTGETPNFPQFAQDVEEWLRQQGVRSDPVLLRPTDRIVGQ